MKKPPLILVIADLHAGSKVAPMPEGFIDHGGNEVKPNKIQSVLNGFWEKGKEWVEMVRDGDEMHLVLNGDMVEGIHHRTTEVTSPEMNDHFLQAQGLLNHYGNLSSRRFVVRGTECHTRDSESGLAKWLNADIDPDTGLNSFDRLRLKPHECPTTFVHHVSTSSRPWTTATGPISALATEQLECVKVGEVPPRVLCFAHRHNFGAYNLGRSLAVVSPPWQLLTRHGYKVVPHARTLTGLYMLDWRRRNPGDLPEVHELLFTQKPSAPIEL